MKRKLNTEDIKNMRKRDFFKHPHTLTVLACSALGWIGTYRIARKLTITLGLDSSILWKALDIFIAILAGNVGMNAGGDFGDSLYKFLSDVFPEKTEAPTENEDIHFVDPEFDDASDVTKRGPRVIK